MVVVENMHFRGIFLIGRKWPRGSWHRYWSSFDTTLVKQHEEYDHRAIRDDGVLWYKCVNLLPVSSYH